jgi:hypothetical protein
MERDTFTASIRSLRQRTPFRPFTVVTTGGGRYEVDHPEAILVRDGLALFAAPGNIPVIFDFDGVSEIIGDLSGSPAST